MEAKSLEIYYKFISDVNSHFARKRTRSAKSQHLSRMVELYDKGVKCQGVNMFYYMKQMTKDFTEIPDYKFTTSNIHAEAVKLYNRNRFKYGNIVDPVIGEWDEVISYFNERYMCADTPSKLKLYDKRLINYVETQNVNMATTYFLMFLILYSE